LEYQPVLSITSLINIKVVHISYYDYNVSLMVRKKSDHKKKALHKHTYGS